MLLDLPRGLVTLVTFTGRGRPLKFERGLEIPPYQPRSGSTSSVAAKPGEAVGRRRSVRRSAVGERNSFIREVRRCHCGLRRSPGRPRRAPGAT